jgi:uncharacterized membrane protein YfcA
VSDGNVSALRRDGFVKILEINFLVQICLIFILAGLVKGVVGFGLPTIGIGLGALISDIPTAMMLILVPTFFTNIVQVLGTGSVAAVLTKTWTFLLGAVILIPIGLWMVILVPEFPFERLLGLLILIYSLASLRGFNPVMRIKNNHLLGLALGLLNSVLTGMTGSMSVPGVMYLRALQLSKEDLLCAMGMLFFTSTLALGGSLWWLDRASGELSILSIVMCVPVALGVWVGMRVRGVLSEDQFKQIFLSAFTVLGAYLAVFGG